MLTLAAYLTSHPVAFVRLRPRCIKLENWVKPVVDLKSMSPWMIHNRRDVFQFAKLNFYTWLIGYTYFDRKRIYSNSHVNRPLHLSLCYNIWSLKRLKVTTMALHYLMKAKSERAMRLCKWLSNFNTI